MANCSKENSPFFSDTSNYIEIDRSDKPSARLQKINQPVNFTGMKSNQAGDITSLSFTLEYLLAPPVVDGVRVQATHLVYKSQKLYLSYNTNGDVIRGGLEVVDFGNPNDPRVTTTGVRDAEFGSLEIFTDSNTGKSYLMMAGAGYSESGRFGGQLRRFELDAQGYPLLNPEITDIAGYAATDVNRLGLVSGTQGGFFTLDEESLGFASLQADFEDARSVSFNPLTGEYVVLLGNPGRLVTGLPNKSQIIDLGGISYEGTKAIVRIGDGYAYAALGDGGMKVVDLANNQIIGSLVRPEIPSGANPRNYVTNSVSVNDSGLLFIANGAAGVYVAQKDEAGQFEVIGILDLDASVNYIESQGDYLFVAAGERGIAIIRMQGINDAKPLVTTHQPAYDAITAFTAQASGQVDQNGASEILNKGFCWNTLGSPSIQDYHTNQGPGAGSFLSNLIGLNENTKYYLRAYVTNSKGTYYGSEVEFSTISAAIQNGEFTDPRDGKVYRTIQLGSQEWMAENLSWLPAVSPVASGSLVDPFYYVYDYNGFKLDQAKNMTSFKTYGVLYNWTAAMGACPEGWHLPSDREWAELEQNLGMDAEDILTERFRNTGSVGAKLKSEAGWFEEGNGNNSSDFSALPSGYRGRGGTYNYQGSNTNFWTSSETEFMAICRGLYYFNDGAYRSNWYKSAGFSVRCLKNIP